MRLCFSALIILLLCTSGCSLAPDAAPPVDRESMIPAGAEKMTPQTDRYPPILHSSDYEQPYPLSGPINTAGYEDSPFFAPEQDELYFFFTPDASIPPEEQLLDGVTGIYVSRRAAGAWQRAERVRLQAPGRLALDGCPFVEEDTRWFCSAREGYTGVQWFSAHRSDTTHGSWQHVDFSPDYQVGELHIHGDELYYHSARSGTKGSTDIWVMRKIAGGWSDPENVRTVNTVASESLPCISPGGDELWFTRVYRGAPAIFRSRRGEEGWQIPELIVSQFAGEPTVDAYGNLYFVHHYFADGKMLESDIYYSQKKE